MTNKNNNKIKVRVTNSAKPALRRDRVKNQMIADESRAQDIKNSLSEIYQDESGEKIDVDKFNIKKKRGIIFWFINLVLTGMILVVLSLGFYYYIYNSGADSTAVEFRIEGPELVNANQEFTYQLKYSNMSNVALSNIEIQAKYPDNFIFQDSEPSLSDGASTWKIDRIGPRASGVIKIKGKILGKSQDSSILLAEMTYLPDNFSSQFKKEDSFNTVLKDVGLVADINYTSTALVGEDNEIIITLKSNNNNYLRDFALAINKNENIEILELVAADDSEINLTATEADSWQIGNLREDNEELSLTYRVVDKQEDKEQMVFAFSQPDNQGNDVVFLEKSIELEVMKSSLNLTMIINGNQNNQPVDFTETLNYSIVYANKGEAVMRDVLIMAVLESDFLDWTTLNDPHGGKERGNTITWSKNEIEGLEAIGVNEEGIIDFSINIADFREGDLGKDFNVKSFAQYNIGELEKIGDISDPTAEEQEEENNQINLDNKSNTIINEINSDLELGEEVRYFNQNNIPVGDGPIPPQVGEETTYKVYWTLNNNLHELNELKVEMPLPEYIVWAEKNRTSVGSVYYDEAGHKVIWDIGRLPITVYRSDAEFSIKFLPQESDRNKVIVLTNGSVITARDVATNAIIERATTPKTTKMEDDDIAAMSSDGRVQ